MKYYFHLQYKIINRTIFDFGLPIFVGYCIAFISFLFFSVQLFEKVTYAAYLYCLVALLLVQPLASLDRNEFLKIHFPNYRIIRVIENIVVAIPFVLFLLYKQEFLISIYLLIFLALLSFIKLKMQWNIFIPTPFKAPFEFNLGFRKTFLVWIIIYLGTVFSILIQNENISIAILLSTFLISTNFYNLIEPEYYLWNYKISAKEFIYQKLKLALFHHSLLTLPILVTLLVVFSSSFIGLFLCYVFGILFLLTIVLAKYASYPNKIDIFKGFMIASCIYFPPSIVFVLIYFYYLSIKKLKKYLK